LNFLRLATHLHLQRLIDGLALGVPPNSHGLRDLHPLVAGLACWPQRSWLLSLHDNQHDTPSFLKSLLNFFVAKREKSGFALTMSLGKWETITVKHHYAACYGYGIDLRWSEPANDSIPTVGPDVTINLGNRVSNIGNSKIFALS
jgi:hypothetical protein